jgi:YD repeat-containing protein
MEKIGKLHWVTTWFILILNFSQNSKQTKQWDYDDDGTLRNFHHSFHEGELLTTYDYSNAEPQCSGLGYTNVPPGCALNRFLPTKVTNPEQHRIELDYDETGKLKSVTKDSVFGPPVIGNVASFVRNKDGTIRTITRPRGETSFEYTYENVTGPLTKISVTDPLNRKSETTYDKVGRIKTRTSAAGKQTTYTFNDLNLLTSVLYDDGTTVTSVTFTYDDNNNLVYMTDSTGTTSFR